MVFLTVNVPYWDDFGAIVSYFAHPFPERLLHLAEFNNEHRIFTARVTFEVLYQLLGRFDFQVCMVIGAVFLLGYAVLLGSLFKKTSARGIFLYLPCFWLLLSFIHYENLCWAMCAVSNIPVHCWALLACLSAVRPSKASFVGTLIFALLATFSTGGGMAVWPCLILLLIFLNRQTPRIILTRCTLIGLFAICAIALYFHDFPSTSANAAPLTPTSRIIHILLFFVSFVGGWIPSFWPALAVGCVTLAAIGYFTFNLPKLRTPAAYFFLIYLLANMAAAALFRSADFKSAISFRYILLPVSVLTCVTLLAEETFLPKLNERTFTILWALFFGGAVLYSSTFLVIGGPLFAKRNEIMRHNILCWPKDVRGLRCPPNSYSECDKALRTVVERGIYNPSILLKTTEPRPTIPIDWLR